MGMGKKTEEQKPIKTPQQFAKAYLLGKSPVGGDMFFEAYLDGHGRVFDVERWHTHPEIGNTGIMLPKLNLRNMRTINKVLEVSASKAKKKLGENNPTLIKTLESNYESRAARKILIALGDLGHLLEKEKEMLDSRKKIKKKKKKLLSLVQEWINATNKIIDVPYFFKTNEKSLLTKIKERFVKWLQPREVKLGDCITYNQLDELKEWVKESEEMENEFQKAIDELKKLKKISPTLYKREKRHNSDDTKKIIAKQWRFKAINLLMYNPKKERKRPYKIINGYIIAIYTLLTNTPPREIKQYKEWCKQLTADLINGSCGKNLSKKDIDNAIHTI